MDHDRSRIREDIKQFIMHNFHLTSTGEELMDDTSLMDAGVVNSTGILELIDFIEDNFNISIENGEVIPENLDSVTNMVRFIGLKIEN
jgi:acyl carrier protein